MRRLLMSGWVLPVLALIADLPADGGSAAFLVLDLEGDGVHLADEHYPVSYDVDGDGIAEHVNWTVSGQLDGFLFSDLDGNGLPTPSELLRVFRPSAGGDPAPARGLVGLDDPLRGGNGDGRLTIEDREVSRLAVWVDFDHDGVADRAETFRVADWSHFEVSLEIEEDLRVDGALNLYAARAPARIAPPGTRRATDTWIHEVRLPYTIAP